MCPLLSADACGLRGGNTQHEAASFAVLCETAAFFSLYILYCSVLTRSQKRFDIISHIAINRMFEISNPYAEDFI